MAEFQRFVLLRERFMAEFDALTVQFEDWLDKNRGKELSMVALADFEALHAYRREMFARYLGAVDLFIGTAVESRRSDKSTKPEPPVHRVSRRRPQPS